LVKTVIIGDSLAAQRVDDGFLKQERWPFLLSEKIAMKLTNLSKGFSTTTRLRNTEVTNYGINSDLIIIQLGIVDCAPRRFRMWEMKLIFKLPSVVKLPVLTFLKKNRDQSVDRAYVNLENFISNITCFYKLAQPPIIFIKILPASEQFISINPKIKTIIQSYNRALDNLSSKLDQFYVLDVPEKIVSQITLDDGYHLNKKGHQFISQELQNIIINEVLVK